MKGKKLNVLICPNCGDMDIEVTDARIDETHYYDWIYCSKCKKTFLFTYKIAKIEEISEGESDSVNAN